eukprot:998825-Prymnesium_polylepis.1
MIRMVQEREKYAGRGGGYAGRDGGMRVSRCGWTWRLERLGLARAVAGSAFAPRDAGTQNRDT